MRIVVKSVATWTGAGIGRYPSTMMEWVLQRGAGAVRTGLKDNIRISKDRSAASNAELVKVAAELRGRYHARPATVTEACAVLHL